LKITKTTTVLAAAATVGIVGAPIASAEDVTTQPVGTQAKLVDGNLVQGWTVTDLRPSADVIPYPVVGTLWEATATDEAIQGSATPSSRISTLAPAVERRTASCSGSLPHRGSIRPRSLRAKRPLARCISM
jgi:Domain of unknown function (DUF1942)